MFNFYSNPFYIDPFVKASPFLIEQGTGYTPPPFGNLLLENGFNILLENGGNILLEG